MSEWAGRDWSGIVSGLILAMCLAVAWLLLTLAAAILEAIDALFVAALRPESGAIEPFLGWWLLVASVVFLGLAAWVLVRFIKWVWPRKKQEVE